MGTPDDSYMDHDGTEQLAEAARQAVLRSLSEVERLQLDVELLVAELRASPPRMAPWQAYVPLDAYCATTEALAAGANADFDKQVDGLETFNIVLFGRTGSGKSSLLSAMARLDGARVSQGESDWTTSAQAVHWRGVRLVDTPGIDGWGRTMSREALEAHARDEVKTADIVLLCFDTQSQQASEFKKVAEWVVDFGKPVIAVLNNRNPMWRASEDVSTMAARRNLSQAVRQHVSHIEDNLEALGLGHVRVVVASARRALDARATDPYEGPDAVGRSRRLARFGAERLLAMSNLLVLESLFVALVSEGAVDLRLASLREGARAVHRNAELELRALDAEAASGGALAEETVASILRVLGYPSPSVRRQALSDERVSEDLLTVLEETRGEPFDAAVRGSLESYADSLLNAHLKPLELQSLRESEEAVRASFDTGVPLDDEAFARKAFDPAAIDRAIEQVWADALDYAGQKLELIVDDAKADAAFAARAFSTAGDAGRGWRYASVGLRAGGLAAGALGTLALTNWWNPAGWVAFAAFGGAFLLGVLGKRAARKAERERLNARNSALGNARRSVRAGYRDLRDEVRRQIVSTAWAAAHQRLKDVVGTAVGYRLLREEVGLLCAAAGSRADRIPPAPHVTDVMQAAVKRVLSSAANPNAAAVLWGEDWVEGGPTSDAEPRPPRPRDDRGSLLAAFRSVVPPLDLDTARSWGDQLSASPRPGLALIGEEFNFPATVPVALVGDYNSGKSSLVKRLLVEAGLPVPPDLVVGAKPTTDEAHPHDLNGLILIDTPGMQSGVSDHEARALEVLGEAPVVLMTFHPNLVLGDTRLLSAMAEGAERTPPRVAHALALVNRADELGVDPRLSPEEFERLCTRKRVELVRALDRHGMVVNEARTWCIASDPYGLVGDTQGVAVDDYAHNADWDGIDALRAGLHELAGPLRDAARATAAVLKGVSRIMGRTVELAEALGIDTARSGELQRVETVVARATSRAEQLRGDLAATAEEFVAAHAREAHAELLLAQSDKDIAAALHQLEHWYETDSFVAEYEAWAIDAEDRINAWSRETSSELLREFSRRTMGRTFPGMPHIDLGAFVADDTGKAGMQLAHEGLTSLVKTFSDRDAVYRVGKAFGYKFRPWEAVNKAQTIGKLAPWMAALGVVLDAASWTIDHHNARKREEARTSADTFLRGSIIAVTDYLLQSDDLAGPVQHLKAMVEILQQVSGTLSEERKTVAERIVANQAELREADVYIESGRFLLDPQRGGVPDGHMG